MYLVTGASGQLGRLIIESLINKSVPPAQIIAMVRSPEKVMDLKQQGLLVRQAQYGDKETLLAAFTGVKRAALVSSSEVGQRFAQHQNVIQAAKQAGIDLLAYTSLLHANTSPMALAKEHQQTEEELKQSGLSHVILRNGWYLENYTANAKAAVQHGVVLGSAGQGRISAASRADYAEAAATVLTSNNVTTKVYELAGDRAFTMAEYAELLAAISKKAIAYQDLPKAKYAAALGEMGLPQPFAEILADSDEAISKGALYNDNQTLSELIGRPTTTLKNAILSAL